MITSLDEFRDLSDFVDDGILYVGKRPPKPEGESPEIIGAVEEEVSFDAPRMADEENSRLRKKKQRRVRYVEPKSMSYDPDAVSYETKVKIARYLKEKSKGVNISEFDPDKIYEDASKPRILYEEAIKSHNKDSKFDHGKLPLNWRFKSDKAIETIYRECIDRCGISDERIPDSNKLDIEEYIEKNWIFHARPTQIPLEGNWTYHVYLAGRGVGKSTAAIQWLISMALKYAGCRIAIVTNTPDEGWKYLVEQTLKVVLPSWINVKYNKNDKTITFPNGSIGILHSAHNPEKLRGARHHFAVCDELCKWKDAEEVFSQLKLTCTLPGKKWGIQDLCNRYFISTTPVPSKMLTELIHDEDAVVMRETTFDNAEFIPSSSLKTLIKDNCGTAFGRQELLGEVLDMSGYSIFKLDDIEKARVESIPRRKVEKIVVGVDPQAAKTLDDRDNPNETGIVVAGIDADCNYYILDDFSVNGTPDEWVRAVQEAHDRWNADYVVAEKSHGFDMVANSFQAHLEHDIAIKYVVATKGKVERATPVSMLYQQGRVRHLGFHDKLEKQMCTWTGDKKEDSPDRIDAMVWAIHELMMNNGYKGFL